MKREDVEHIPLANMPTKHFDFASLIFNTGGLIRFDGKEFYDIQSFNEYLKNVEKLVDEGEPHIKKSDPAEASGKEQCAGSDR